MPFATSIFAVHVTRLRSTEIRTEFSVSNHIKKIQFLNQLCKRRVDSCYRFKGKPIRNSLIKINRQSSFSSLMEFCFLKISNKGIKSRILILAGFKMIEALRSLRVLNLAAVALAPTMLKVQMIL